MADSRRNNLWYPRMLTIPSPNLKHNDMVKMTTIAIDDNMKRKRLSTFYSKNDVLTISLHTNHGLWGASHPQARLTNEASSSKGKGFNINVPLWHGTGDKDYELVMSELVIPAIDNFKSKMIVMTFG